MTGPRRIIIRVQYDRYPIYGRSLAWIAPELRDSPLSLTDDCLDAASPSREWAGVVDGRTFERFAGAWQLAEPEDTPHTYVLDGMNWEAGGASPIVFVVLEVRDATPAREIRV